MPTRKIHQFKLSLCPLGRQFFMGCAGG